LNIYKTNFEMENAVERSSATALRIAPMCGSSDKKKLDAGIEALMAPTTAFE